MMKEEEEAECVWELHGVVVPSYHRRLTSTLLPLPHYPSSSLTHTRARALVLACVVIFSNEEVT